MLPQLIALLILTTPATATTPSAATPAQENPMSVLNHVMKTADDQSVNLDSYRGKVLLMVNVASKCGLTPQYEALEALHAKLAPRGFTILGFPANNFGSQEPGTNSEIQEFCKKNYGVTFPVFGKISVLGADKDPLYVDLTGKEKNPANAGEIQWNFEKFLIAKDGSIAARFSPKVTPNDPAILAAIETELAK